MEGGASGRLGGGRREEGQSLGEPGGENKREAALRQQASAHSLPNRLKIEETKK